MTPSYLSQISPNPLIEGQDESQPSPFTLATDTSSFPFPTLFNTPQDRVSGRDHHPQQQQLQPKPIDLLLVGRPSDRPVLFPTNNNNNNDIIEQSLCGPYVGEEDPQGSGKWMSSKMRIMRKMMKDRIDMSKTRTNIHVLGDQPLPNQGSSSSNSNSNSNNSLGVGIIRVCSDCNTTKTPLWRSGPGGPKSLCNACGIRQRKARRAMAAAAVSGSLVPTETPSKVQKEKRSDVDRTVPFKKRYKITNSGTDQKKLRFDDITISLSKNSAFHRVFPQDERDAAILLMALSCGLIRS